MSKRQMKEREVFSTFFIEYPPCVMRNWGSQKLSCVRPQSQCECVCGSFCQADMLSWQADALLGSDLKMGMMVTDLFPPQGHCWRAQDTVCMCVCVCACAVRVCVCVCVGQGGWNCQNKRWETTLKLSMFNSKRCFSGFSMFAKMYIHT